MQPWVLCRKISSFFIEVFENNIAVHGTAAAAGKEFALNGTLKELNISDLRK